MDRSAADAAERQRQPEDVFQDRRPELAAADEAGALAARTVVTQLADVRTYQELAQRPPISAPPVVLSGPEAEIRTERGRMKATDPA